MHDAEIIMNTIRNIEQGYPVQTWTIGDVHIWPLIRTNTIVRHKSLNNKANENNPARKKLFSRVKGLFNRRYVHNKIVEKDILGQSGKYDKCDILFLSYSMYRTFYSDNGIWDVHVIPLMKKIQNICNLKYNILEIDVDGYAKQPRYGKSYYINYDIDMIATKIRIRKALHITKKLSVNMPKFDEVMEIFSNNNFTTLVGMSIDELYEYAIFIKAYTKYFENIIRKSGAKLGVTVCYYTPLGFAFNAACKNCGITTADLQHGLNSKYHIAYAHWNLLYDYYKELPDRYLCWWKKTQDVINSWSKNRGVYIGFPWSELWMTGGELERQYIPRINKYVKQNCTIHILYTMQTGLDIEQSVIDVVNSSPKNWQWWFRLHPSMLKDINKIEESLHKRIRNTNIEIKQATYMPLYALMIIANIHITCYSSVYMECAMHGIPSIMFSGHNLYESIEKNGMVKVIDVKDISKEIISEQMKQGCDTKQEDDECDECEQYFRKVLNL